MDLMERPAEELEAIRFDRFYEKAVLYLLRWRKEDDETAF